MTSPLKSHSCRILLVFALLFLAISAQAMDMLEMPALKNGQATRALLLDIAGRGDNAFVAVGEHGVIVYSEDGGATWTQAAVPTSVMLTGVYFPTAQSGWAVGHDGVILHSGDGGQSWQKQLDGNQLNEQIIAVAERIVEQLQAEVDRLQAAQDSGEAVDESAMEDAEYRLEEAEFMLEGAQDDASAGPVRPLLDVWFRNELEGFVVGSYGMLLYTGDAGATWSLVSDRMDNIEAYHLNEITAAPDGALYIAGESGFIYRSTDGGQSWDSLQPGYEGSFYGVLAVPSGVGLYDLLAYGLRGNLFVSTDRGETWSSVDSGTTITLTTGMVLSDGAVVLAGQGGILLTRAAGQARFAAASNPDRRVISGVAQASDGHLLLVGLGGIRQAMSDGAPLETVTQTN